MTDATGSAGIDRLRELLERAGLRVHANGAGFKAQCPCHPDEVPSMDFRVGDRAPVVAKCHAGSCGADLLAMLEELGASDADRGVILGGTPNREQSSTPREYVHHVYEDADGNPLARKVRGVCGGMTAKRPDGRKDITWEYFDAGRWLTRAAWNHAHPGVQPPKPGLYHAPAVGEAGRNGRMVFVAEGEKAADALERIGCSPATTNPHGAGKWTPADSALLVGASAVVVFEDDDESGRSHCATVARDTHAAGVSNIRIVRFEGQCRLDGQVGGGDVADWIAERERAGDTLEQVRDELLQRVAAATRFSPPQAAPPPNSNERPAAWASARSASEFLSTPELEVDFLEDRILARGSLTLWNSPRGLGKTLAAHAICVKQARAGRRVLIVDRDNSRRELKRRLRGWGADTLTTLMVLGRDHAPPLTDRRAWEVFPIAEYEIVMIDSIDASTEGVGEQDSGKPSAALASLLDVVHTAEGPAILVLGNTTKSGTHGRGSGVIEDRADIVFEVRDATDLRPSGTKDWWLELPAADRGAWGNRASRRKRRDSYRLAFVPSKFRVGEEPDPFVFELKLIDPWECREVTDDVVRAGAAAVEQAAHEAATRLDTAAAALRAEVWRCTSCGTPMKARDDAEPFLVDRGLTRRAARKLIVDREGQDWRRFGTGKKNDPVVLVPPHAPRGDVSASISINESPHPERTVEPTIPADRMDQGPPESTCTSPAIDAAARDPLIPADLLCDTEAA